MRGMIIRRKNIMGTISWYDIVMNLMTTYHSMMHMISLYEHMMRMTSMIYQGGHDNYAWWLGQWCMTQWQI